jgi:hypothetical protein
VVLRFCDSFDAASSSGDLTKKWASADASWTWASGAGKFGGGCLVNTGASGGKQILSPAWVPPNQQFCMGFYLKASAAPAALSPVALVMQAPTAWMSISLTTAGFAAFYDSQGGTLRQTSTIPVCDNNWHWIEFRSDGFNNNAYLYVDNVLQGALFPCGGYSPANIAFQSAAGITVSIDDPVFYDSSGAVPNFTVFPLGARQITVVRPSSDGTVQFGTVVGGTGTHASCLNETAPDGDTSYVEDGTVGDQDLLNMGALGYTPATITCVVENLYVENAAGGTVNINSACKSGATTSTGTAIATPLTYRTVQWAFPTDPNTSAAWTASGLNAAQFGYKVA